MRFIVTRTSLYDDSKPCDEAVLRRVSTHTHFTFKNVQDAKAKYPHLDFEQYRPGAVRSTAVAEDVWCVEVSSLDELMGFYRKYGSLVIEPWYRNHELPELEIYDGYRE